MRPENLYPKLSLNIAVRNEGKRIATLLNSIVNQTYPESCLEILIVDGLSSDNTLEIVKRYSKDFDIPVRIIDNPKMDCPTGRKLGLLNATGDLHLYLDADMELAETTTLEKLVKPLIKYPDVVGSFTRLLASPDDPPLNRFLSYNPFQHDPLFEFLSNNVENTVCEKCEEGYKCIFSFGSVPVVGVILCKTNILKKVYEQSKSGLIGCGVMWIFQ
jgi:glycosyltransferase involved in cell wall biosynthesis